MIRNRRFGLGRGALKVIALFLVASAVLRLGSDAGTALAQAVAGTGLPISQTQPEQVETGMSKPDKGMQTTAPPGDPGTLLAALQAREQKLRQQEEQIELRRKALAVADAEIEKRLQALQSAEQTLRRTLTMADGAAEDDLARLTTVYENMKPKEASALFETMDPGFAAGFLGRMRPESAAAVMAGLTPETAYRISVILASRNSRAPKS